MIYIYIFYIYIYIHICFFLRREQQDPHGSVPPAPSAGPARSPEESPRSPLWCRGRQGRRQRDAGPTVGMRTVRDITYPPASNMASWIKIIEVKGGYRG